MEASFLIGMAVVPLPWYKKVLPTALTVSRAYATIIILVLFEYGWYLTGLGVRSRPKRRIIWTDIWRGAGGYLSAGSVLDTLVDKLLHVPLFSYFLFSPKPKLPHFFLIHDVVVRIGYAGSPHDRFD